MTTRTAHPERPGPRVRLYHVWSEQGSTYLWSTSEDNAAYCAYSHDLVPGLATFDGVACREADLLPDERAAAEAVADEHIRYLFAPPHLRQRGRDRASMFA